MVLISLLLSIFSIISNFIYIIYNNYSEIQLNKLKSEVTEKLNINKEENYWIFGFNGVGKTSQILKHLDKQKVFFYDCTFDKYLQEKIFISKLKLPFILKCYYFLICWYYDVIVIDDLHLTNKEEIFNIWNLLKKLRFKQLFIITWNNRFEFKNNVRENMTEHISIVNLINKIDDKFKFIELELKYNPSLLIQVQKFLRDEFNFKMESRRHDVYLNENNFLDTYLNQIYWALNEKINTSSSSRIENLIDSKIKNAKENFLIRTNKKINISELRQEQLKVDINNFEEIFWKNFKNKQMSKNLWFKLKMWIFLINLDISENDFLNTNQVNWNRIIGKYINLLNSDSYNKDNEIVLENYEEINIRDQFKKMVEPINRRN